MTDSLHVVCPHCDAINRVQASSLNSAPNCGKCQQALFVGASLSLSMANFDRHIGRSDLPVMVDFWAPWCGPCRAMAPAFEEAAAELEPYMRLAKVDTQAEQALGTRFQIRSIPTMAMFKGGQLVAQQAGAMGVAGLVAWAKAAAAK